VFPHLFGSLFAATNNSRISEARKEKMVAKKKRGRPATGRGEQIQVRLHPDLMKQLDQWRSRDPDVPNRPEAIRRLMQLGLKFRWKPE
jgi:hypothetical protein